MSNNNLAKTILITSFALVAFAGNSVLCRVALGGEYIDATSFTVIRLFSGAVVLLVMLKFFGEKNASSSKGSWGAASMLFMYASAFSFAYVSLDTGTGALILFGSVQLTMLVIAVSSGDRLHLSEWLGITVAFCGFVYLILPTVTTPSFVGLILMAVSGIAWGIYTLMGRKSKSPLSDTSGNFIRTLPFIVVLGLFFLQDSQLSQKGILLAVLSGAIASGVGYTIWYMALRGLSASIAAVAQLLVPVVAALGGVIFVSEDISLHFMLSATLILGGIAMVVLGKYCSANSKVV